MPRYGQELPSEISVLRNNWSLKAGKAFQNNEERLESFLNWEFKFQFVGEKKRKTPPLLFLENAWIETSWNQHTTAIDCHAKWSIFMKTTQQKLFITHSKLFQASLCDLYFGNLRPTLSMHKKHKEMDAILFLGKQANPNITITEQNTFHYHRSSRIPWWRNRL